MDDKSPQIILFTQGAEARLDTEALSIVIGTRSNFTKLVFSSLRLLDFSGLFLLVKSAAKSLAKQDYTEEKKKLLLHRLGFVPTKIRLSMNGKVLEFDANEKLLLQSLYQIASIFVKNSYMLDDAHAKGKVVVDAGANLGFFSFFAFCMGAKKVYAFEPVESTMLLLRKNIVQNGLENSIVAVGRGLGSKEGKARISFDESGDQTATLLSGSVKRHSQEISITTLDNFFNHLEVSFIKMDTEGYEAEIISGGAELIKRCKPAMCLSAYHKKGDRERLPAMIRKIRPDYTIRLVDFGEENIYCT